MKIATIPSDNSLCNISYYANAGRSNNRQTILSSFPKIQQAASSLIESGFSVLPVNGYDHKEDPKKSVIYWKPYQDKIMTPDEVQRYFAEDSSIAVICGKISGNLECLDIDSPELFQPFLDALAEIDQPLHDKLIQRQTPSGGFHLVYRCESEIPGNQKLAMSSDGKETLIETRGTGGYFLSAPSPGYKVLKGSLKDIATISEGERDLLINLAKSFTKQFEVPTYQGANSSNETRPGDLFNQHRSHEVPDILISNGWERTGRTGPGGDHWRRPGKTKGTSATLKGDCFYLFSTNAGMPTGSHSPFSVYTHLVHDGDFQEAARTLSADQSVSWQAIVKEPIQWQQPVVLGQRELPSVDVEGLPSVLGDMVKGVAAATETPVELGTLYALGTLSAACQGCFIVEPEPGYIEPTNTYTASFLDPGNRKSSVQRFFAGPLLDYEREKAQEMEPLILEASARSRNQEARISVLRSQYAKAKSDQLAEIEKELMELEKNVVEIPTKPQIWTQDVTPERAGSLMSENDGRLAILSAEGGIFENIGGRYSGGTPNLDLFLQAHSGDSVRVDRGQRSVYMDSPALTIAISMQPGVLASLARHASFRHLGLWARFLMTIPQSPLGRRTLQPIPLDQGVRERFNNCVTALFRTEKPLDSLGKATPYTLRLSKEAHSQWKAFSLGVERELGDGGEFEHLRDWGGKLPGQAARIAAVFHCAENANNQPWTISIKETTMTQALNLAAVLSRHAIAVFDLMGASQELNTARKIWSWIKRTGNPKFTKRNCYQALKGSFPKVADLEPGLSMLADRYYIRQGIQDTKGAGRKSDEFEVNPLAMEV